MCKDFHQIGLKSFSIFIFLCVVFHHFFISDFVGSWKIIETQSSNPLVEWLDVPKGRWMRFIVIVCVTCSAIKYLFEIARFSCNKIQLNKWTHSEKLMNENPWKTHSGIFAVKFIVFFRDKNGKTMMKWFSASVFYLCWFGDVQIFTWSSELWCTMNMHVFGTRALYH